MLAFLALCWTVCTGCYAPLRSTGISASRLPEEYRTPRRTAGPQLNLSTLTLETQGDYILGPDDLLDLTIEGLYRGVEVRPIRVRVMTNGTISLPMIGAVKVAGMNLAEASDAVTRAYAEGNVLKDTKTSVLLAEKSSTSVVVLGEVRTPGVQRLPKYENDVAHALAAAGGLAEDAADEIEIHRRRSPIKQMGGELIDFQKPRVDPEVILLGDEEKFNSEPRQPGGVDPKAPLVLSSFSQPAAEPELEIVRIPLRGNPTRPIRIDDVVLQNGDVVVVPSRKSEVFYVVGKLSPTNFVRFNIGARERDLGAGFLLPKDREIDVVTAVAMAGYIDPIDSPTTVTVHRVCPSGEPALIIVDLIKARTDRCENLLVEAGDIIYLNPDVPWYFRRTFDRLVDNLFSFGVSYRIPTGGKN
jgi:protein involved in polysaccharide export with SLBB domain